ncbi:MAG TPA: hypothetical protein PLN21_03120 [Gemmatales bacterium]|nr:hypothetical protein [Gemmatales bacterium]
MFSRMKRWMTSLLKKSSNKPAAQQGTSTGSTDRHKPLKRRSSRRHRTSGGGHDWSAGVYM